MPAVAEQFGMFEMASLERARHLAMTGRVGRSSGARPPGGAECGTMYRDGFRSRSVAVIEDDGTMRVVSFRGRPGWASIGSSTSLFEWTAEDLAVLDDRLDPIGEMGMPRCMRARWLRGGEG